MKHKKWEQPTLHWTMVIMKRLEPSRPWDVSAREINDFLDVLARRITDEALFKHTHARARRALAAQHRATTSRKTGSSTRWSNRRWQRELANERVRCALLREELRANQILLRVCRQRLRSLQKASRTTRATLEARELETCLRYSKETERLMDIMALMVRI